MKQTYIMKKISKLNESDYTIDEWNNILNGLVKQITIWDDPEYLKRNKPPVEEQEDIDAGVYDEVEIYKGAKSIDFSKDNWSRLKEGKPIVLPKVFRPKRLDSRNSTVVYGRKIYMVKKNVNLTPTQNYCAFDVKTGILLCLGTDKHKIEKFLIDNLQDKLDILEKEESE